MNGDPGSRTGRIVMKGIVRGLWWVLKAILGPILPLALVVLILGLLVVVQVLGFQESIGRESVASAASEAAQAGLPPTVSFDGAERAHIVPWAVVAAVQRQVEQETGASVSARAIAGALAPQFSYRPITLATVSYVSEENAAREPVSGDDLAPGSREVRAERQVVALAAAETIAGLYTYRYRVHRVERNDGWEEVVERESTSYRENAERLLHALTGLLQRPVSDWEAQWLMHLADGAENGGIEPGRWLLSPAGGRADRSSSDGG